MNRKYEAEKGPDILQQNYPSMCFESQRQITTNISQKRKDN
jgi:hypothetical protein